MDKKKGVLLVLATAFISGFSIFINKYSVSKIDPSAFTFLKNGIVALFLAGILLLAHEWRNFRYLTRKQWLQLILIGAVGGSVPFILFFKGLSLTSAASAGFIHKTMFLYVAVMAAIFLKEKLSKPMVIGTLLLLVGNFLLVAWTSVTFGKGDLLVLAATLFWAVENILSKKALKELSGNIVAFGRMFFGSLFILIYLAFVNKVPVLFSLSGKDILWTIMTSVLLLLFVATYYNGLRYIKVSVATSILMLGSPITTLLTMFSGQWNVSLAQLMGIMSIVMGSLIVIFFGELVREAASSVLSSRPHTRSE